MTWPEAFAISAIVYCVTWALVNSAKLILNFGITMLKMIEERDEEDKP